MKLQTILKRSGIDPEDFLKWALSDEACGYRANSLGFYTDPRYYVLTAFPWNTVRPGPQVLWSDIDDEWMMCRTRERWPALERVLSCSSPIEAELLKVGE